MKAKAIKTTGMACVGLMLASCASAPFYGQNGYGGGSYPNGGGIDYTRTAALVAAGVAGLSLYHYSQEKDKRKDAERALQYQRGGWGQGAWQDGGNRRRRF